MTKGGVRACKICHKVRVGCVHIFCRTPPAAAARALFFYHPLTSSESSPLPRQTLPLGSFSPPQLRKAKSACDVCCVARADKGGEDHDATSLRKSGKEIRKERKEKRKRDDDAVADETGTETNTGATETKGAMNTVTTENPTTATETVEPRKPPESFEFGAVERFDPNAEESSNDDEDADEKKTEKKTEDSDDDDANALGNTNTHDSGTTDPDDEKATAAQLRKRQVYLGGVPFYKTEHDIRVAFETEDMLVETMECFTFPDSGRFRGIAVLTFVTRESAKKALAWNGEEWDGKFLVVKKYAPKDREGGAGGDGDATKTKPVFEEEVKKTDGQKIAFVCNLNWDVTEEVLRNVFDACGEITEIRMGKDRETQHFKGFAHVEFVADAGLEKAVALSGFDLLGRGMKVVYATARKSAEDRDEDDDGRRGSKKSGERGGRGGSGGGRDGRGGGRGRGGRGDGRRHVAKKE